MNSFASRRPALRERGAAIILVLCFVVLIAGLTVTFLLRAATERQISNANANGTKVELLGDTALGIVVDDLKQEIIAHSTPYGTGTNTVYVPTSATYAVPSRYETLPNLLRRSSHSDTPTRAAASISTAASNNGRSVTLARWNAHYLLPLAGANAPGDSTPASGFVAPDWVVVTRGGPASGAAWTKSLADSSPQNTAYAIGRYAYAIYDEGSLLDMNAAGYPSSATADQYGSKGGLSYADLRQLSLTAQQINQIVGWRNYGSIQPAGNFPNFTFDTAAASRYQTQVATTNNFLTTTTNTFNGNGDHAVINRQQLIKLFQKGISTSSTEQTKLQGALQYLGTFSREVNGPTYGPTVDYAAPYNYKTAQYQTGSTIYNPFVLRAQVASPFTRADGSTAVKGEPLVKSRFPLEKLALLEKMQGYASLSDQDKDDIARYFGLDAVNDSVGYYRHWSYPTTNAKYAHTAGSILSLNDVAQKNREPDFFELLQAGILYGSLGKGGGRGDTAQYTTFTDYDTKTILQVLKIGANIIDQWDSDNYPTTITLTPTATGDSVYGIEDLPYINKFLYTIAGPGNLAAAGVYKTTAAFQLWNPHQSLASNTGAYPEGIQLSPVYVNGTSSSMSTTSDFYQLGAVVTTKKADGTTTSPTWYWNGKTAAWTSGAFPEFFGELPSGGIISVPLANPSTDYREPTMSAQLPLRDMVGIPDNTYVVNSLTFSAAMAAKTALYLYWKPSITYRIQFLDKPGGTYHTYGTFVGPDTPSAYSGFRMAPWLSLSNTLQASKWYAAAKSDPRTGRFGSGQSSEYDVVSGSSSITPASPSSYTDVNSRIDSNPPFKGTVSSANPYRLDLWAANNPGGGTANPQTAGNPVYADLDAQARPGDALYASPSPLVLGASTARPVILNRPFRSVGELGYVFRDLPWKTLDFFTASSADAALLDLFSLNGGQPVLGGRLNPNTRQKSVLSAVIAGATQGSGGSGTTISSDNANSIADAVIALSKAAPFANRSELVTRLMADASLAKISTIKSEREGVVRALADCANTRTWNLLIDLIAQVGRYPSTANSLDKFVVEGERHYWLHVAIDRYTGQIVDKQLEVVRE